MDRRQKDLADFLRSRRERLKPADAGLRSGMRRRTPGLRREEVADLAGIGTGWYTFLEQGRDVRPSEGAIKRIARALQLDPAEEKYLLRLTHEAPSTKREQSVVQPELAQAIRGMTQPAFVMDRAWEMLDFNEAADALYDFRYLPYRNHLRLTFAPEMQLFCENWEQRARQLVGAFRVQNAARLRDERVAKVVEDLRESSPLFRAWWAEQAVREENGGVYTCLHPFVGRLEFSFVMLEALDSPGLVAKFYSCLNEETRRRVEELIRELHQGEHGPDHNLWTALRARDRAQPQNGRDA